MCIQNTVGTYAGEFDAGMISLRGRGSGCRDVLAGEEDLRQDKGRKGSKGPTRVSAELRRGVGFGAMSVLMKS
jgi:hypothetical protein